MSANPCVLPSRPAPVVCHSRPLCGPAGCPRLLLSAVTVARRGSCARTPGEAGSSTPMLPSPYTPLWKTQPALTSLLVTPPLRQLLRPSAGGAAGKRKHTTVRSWRHLSCSEDGSPLLRPRGLRPPGQPLRNPEKFAAQPALAVAHSTHLGQLFPPARPSPGSDSRRCPVPESAVGSAGSGQVSFPIAAAACGPRELVANGDERPRSSL